MQPVTILREYKIEGACADCGRPSPVLTGAYNRFTESNVLICPACLEWHLSQTDEKVRVGSWGAALPGASQPTKLGSR